jgi:hypothetical protein
MTKYLVLRESNGSEICWLSLEKAGGTHTKRLECWAVDDGDRVEFVRNRINRVMKPFYMSGSLDQQAVFALSFDEMMMLLVKHIGPCDQSRSLIAHRMLEERFSAVDNEAVHTATIVTVRGLGAVLHVIWRCFRYILVQIAVAIFLGRSRK